MANITFSLQSNYTILDGITGYSTWVLVDQFRPWIRRRTSMSMSKNFQARFGRATETTAFSRSMWFNHCFVKISTAHEYTHNFIFSFLRRVPTTSLMGDSPMELPACVRLFQAKGSQNPQLYSPTVTLVALDPTVYRGSGGGSPGLGSWVKTTTTFQ
jgi:hypothetical protein